MLQSLFSFFISLSKESIVRKFLVKLNKAMRAASLYFAYSTALVSRMTVTLMCPG
jgi:hypothetical protein